MYVADTLMMTIIPLVCKFCQKAMQAEDNTLPVVAKQLGRLCHGLQSEFISPAPLLYSAISLCTHTHTNQHTHTHTHAHTDKRKEWKVVETDSCFPVPVLEIHLKFHKKDWLALKKKKSFSCISKPVLCCSLNIKLFIMQYTCQH